MVNMRDYSDKISSSIYHRISFIITVIFSALFKTKDTFYTNLKNVIMCKNTLILNGKNKAHISIYTNIN